MKKAQYSISIILFLIIGVFPINVHAQYENINKHVIIAFDNSLPKKVYTETLKDDQKMESAIVAVLEKLNMREGDYYSLVNFGISKYDSNINNLARPVIDKNNQQIIWRDYVSVPEMFTHQYWWTMTSYQGMCYVQRHSQPFSLLTGAKSYVLTSVDQSEKMASRTFLVMITDDQYNGNNDQNTEFNTMNPPYMSKDDFLKTCYGVAQYYNFRYDSKVVIDKRGAAPYCAFLYEVVPSSSFSLGSVLDYPANLGLTRVKGGYKLDFDFQSVLDEYQLKRLEIRLLNLKNAEEPVVFNSDSTAEIFIRASQLQSDSLTVELKGWFLQKDGIYDGALLNPNDDHFSRLMVVHNLELKDEAKIFGVLPIWDFLWPSKNMQSTVIFWDVIVLLILIIVVCIIAYKLFNRVTMYAPQNDKFKITKL